VDAQRSLLEEAQRWIRLPEDASASDQAALAAWIRRSPQHLQAYLQMQALEAELEGLDSHAQIDLDKLLARSANNVVEIGTALPRRQQRQTRRWWPAAAIGAIAAVAIVATLLHQKVAAPLEYSTNTGEQRRIALADGSIIELNTQSHIRVSYTRSLRQVELLAGEALFNVKHNLARPFRVVVASQVIDDLATEFDVYLHPDAVTSLAVVTGRVQVSSPSSAVRLAAGEQLTLSSSGEPGRRDKVDTAAIASWRKHRIGFENTPIAAAAAEFNRYNQHKIQIIDAAKLDHKRYTATWDPYDLASFLDYLRGDPQLRVDSGADLTTVRAR